VREEVVEGQGVLPKWHKRITQGQKIGEQANNNNKEQQQLPFYPFEGSARDFSFFVCLKITPAAALEPCKADASSTQHRVQREQLESQAQPASPSHYSGQGGKMSTCITCLDFGVLNVPGGFLLAVAK
jgi:hypothetical protein